MKEAEKILSNIETMVDQLVSNAELLHESSRTQFLEEDLLKLQIKQEQLVESIQEADSEFKSVCHGKYQDYKSPILTRIEEKLDRFQKLNTSFIENLSSSRGLIQFEMKQKKTPAKKKK